MLFQAELVDITTRGTQTMTDQEPVAWAVWHQSEDAPGRIAYAKPIQSLRGTGETRDGEEFIPLYGKPTLTAEEREAIEDAAGICEEHAEEYDGTDSSPIAATLRKLLERLK